MGRRRATAIATALLLGIAGCMSPGLRALEVTATAYNSLPGQTHGDPSIAAWGDRLEPGMQAIAVSRDLLELGLTRGAEVEIDGLPGRWVVMDKMSSRWTERIDLYMGVDRDAALQWGRRRVTIRWKPPHS